MTFQDFLDIKKKEIVQSTHRSILAIDTSTQLASVCLLFQGKPLFSEECFRQKSHSEWINDAVERAINSIPGGWDSIDVIAVTKGPGSFTGLRVATNLVKTMSYIKNKPVVAMSSLDILAHQSAEIKETNYILTVINAFKNMVFFSLYQRDESGKIQQVIEAKAVEIIELQTQLPIKSKFQVIGDGYLAYKSYLDSQVDPKWIRANEIKDYPLASKLAQMVDLNWTKVELVNWKYLIPTYLRASAAEENQLLKK